MSELELHRRFGATFNNEVWELLDAGLSPASPPADRDRALYGAFASARHWHECGGPANRARAEHLISRAAAAVGEPGTALTHARRCVALVHEHRPEMADWDAPFAHEALARALAACGDEAAARAELARAVELISAVADPDDREVLQAQLTQGPWFGLEPVSDPAAASDSGRG